MGKQRMTALDVRASVEEMRANLVGLRLLNLYDMQARMFLFRFGDSESKKNVLLENGVRIHLTSLEREKPKVPSQFTLKLRKHIRAWRLASITQLSHDRTVDMCFGVAGTEGCFHIIIELFSKGNMILTDHAYSIMMLLRTHKDEDVSLVVRGVYPVTAPLPLAPVQQEQQQQQDQQQQPAPDGDRTATLKEMWDTVLTRGDDNETLKSILSGVKHFGPSLSEHITARTKARLTAELTRTGGGEEQDQGREEKRAAPTTTALAALLALLKPGVKKKDIVSASAISPEQLFEALLPAMQEAWDIAEAPVLPPGGYLIKLIKATKPNKGATNGGSEEKEKTKSSEEAVAASVASVNTQVITSAERFDDFSPILLAQYKSEDEEGQTTTTTTSGSAAGVSTTYKPSFGAVCDSYFLSTETEHIEKHNKKQSKTVLSKREKFERDFQRRVSLLEQEQELNHHKGELIILNADRVDQAIDLINGALAAGIQWDALKQLLRRRHAEGHAVAYMINELSLERNSMTVLLEQELYDDEDDGDVEPVEVEVNLAKSAHANAADYFSKRKANQAKLEKTLAAQDKAAAGADRKGARLAAKQDAKKQILVVRTREWWEKMAWFVTSAGDVVLQGKDIQTTEIVVRRLMRVGDFLVHCDVDGALPCLVRPMSAVWAATGQGEGESRLPIAHISLEEAGAWCVSRSAAYEQKNIVGSWWVYASQLTGGAASGTYLYEGEKHHLTPRPLALGCALLCRVARDTRRPPEDEATGQSASPEEEEEEGEDPHTETAATLVPTRCPPWLRYLSPEQLLGAAAAVPADTAEELHELPSVETLRPNRPRGQHPGNESAHAKVGKAKQKQQQQLPAPAAAAAATAPASGHGSNHKDADDGDDGGAAAARRPSKKTTRHTDKGNKGVSRSQQKQEMLAARNERITIEQAFVAKQRGGDNGVGEGSDANSSEDDEAAALRHLPRGTFDPKRPPPPPQLTKHQKKKLKKIQAKYADQDEEDRQRGAMINGNSLSKAQQHLLELQAEDERRALAEQHAREKEQRGRDRKAGKLRYLDPHPTGSADDNDEDEGEETEVEMVDSFTDEDEAEVEAEVSAVGEGVNEVGGQGPSTSSPGGHESAKEEEEEQTRENNDQEEAGAGEDTVSVGSAEQQQQYAAARTRATTNRDAAHIAAANDRELKAALPFYTPFPAPSDDVLHVVCVCAPLSVVGSYPYCAELALVPGAKKGQVAEKALAWFTARASGQPLPGDKKSQKRAEAEARREARRAMESSTSTAATTMTTLTTNSSMAGGGLGLVSAAAAAHPAVLKALGTLDVTDVVEQLRANAATVMHGESGGSGKRRK